MKRTLCAVGLVATCSVAPPMFAADSCGGGCPKPPSSARAVSANTTLSAYAGNSLSATLAKGKKKTILMADGVLTDGSYPPMLVSREFALGIGANGISMQPSGGGTFEVVEDCAGTMHCTVTGHWWLDLDDPQNSVLLGVPITVELAGGDTTAGPEVGKPVDMSLRVRLEKK